MLLGEQIASLPCHPFWIRHWVFNKWYLFQVNRIIYSALFNKASRQKLIHHFRFPFNLYFHYSHALRLTLGIYWGDSRTHWMSMSWMIIKVIIKLSFKKVINEQCRLRDCTWNLTIDSISPRYMKIYPQIWCVRETKQYLSRIAQNRQL